MASVGKFGAHCLAPNFSKGHSYIGVVLYGALVETDLKPPRSCSRAMDKWEALKAPYIS
jgi:hypothetical protein